MDVIKFKKLRNTAQVPFYGSPKAAAADLFADCIIEGDGSITLLEAGTEVTVAPHSAVKVGTGIAIDFPEGKAGYVLARSGMSFKTSLAPINKVGLIDEDYRGEIAVGLLNSFDTPQTFRIGDKIAQLQIVEARQYQFSETDELSETERGANGYGSTGM